MYQVLARKWRPTTFEELVGQPHVSRILTNAIQSGRIAHAYIFAGLRGTGKTSAARILARCLNCEKGPTPTPCNRCVPCVEIAESRALDVLEIDAASRTGVDDIRELQEVVAYPPVRDRYKLLIIDEAHMLSKQAFNALLKTLEEPPPRVVFLLATTEIQKLLPTILSRCQVLEYRRVTQKDVAAHLRRLCEAEKVTVSDASLHRIARAGEGSVRDSLSVLERVLASCGSEIADEDVLQVLGAVQAQVLLDTVAGLAARDTGRTLGVLDALVDEGHDLVHFWSELISVLRDLMLLRAAPDRSDLISRSQDETAALQEASGDLSIEDLSRIFQLLSELEYPLKSSAHPRFLFEACLIRLGTLGAVRPIEEVLSELGAPARPASPGQKKNLNAPARPGSPAASPRPATPRVAARTATPPPVTAPQPVAPAPAATPATAPAAASESAPPAPAVRPAGSNLHALLLAEVQRQKPMLAAILESAVGVAHRDGRMTVELPADRVMLRRQLERRENLEMLAGCAEPLIGSRPDVEIHVRAAEGGDEVQDPEVLARPPEVEEEHAAPDRRMLTQRARDEPGVAKLLRDFGAQIMEIKPLEERVPLAEPGAPPAESEDNA